MLIPVARRDAMAAMELKMGDTQRKNHGIHMGIMHVFLGILPACDVFLISDLGPNLPTNKLYVPSPNHNIKAR